MILNISIMSLLRTEWVKQTMSSLWEPFVSSVLIAPESISVMFVLYTFSCNISNVLLSIGFKSGELGASV